MRCRSRRRPTPPPRSAPPAPAARTSAVASGGGASGSASRISARRSVYFHSSTRRLGRPACSKRPKASWRNAAIAPAPGSAHFAAAKCAESALSAAVLIGRTSAFMSEPSSPSLQVQVFKSKSSSPSLQVQVCKRRLCGILLVLRVALRLELQRDLLAAAAHDAAARQHMHHIRDDVIEQALVMGDDDESAFRRAQLIDPLGDDLERIDVEA